MVSFDVSVPNPKCSKPESRVEYMDGVPVQCLYTACSPGFTCEYSKSRNRAQYICCSDTTDSVVGKVRMYPNSDIPLQCFSPTACHKYPETPNCVSSDLYGFNVCCSTTNCS
ncbi:unnamed protein product [Thelazia callipaeda]|uniref:EB domain-containing protein n=1 Tax=Thelazia callipaeda TaxID=103827 RepID=A0A0N5CT29_THECL|nr:unnamed protein product [Thelazia callipaeda]